MEIYATSSNYWRKLQAIQQLLKITPQDFEDRYPALDFTVFSENYLTDVSWTKQELSVALLQVPWGPDWANSLDNVVCTHVQEGARQIENSFTCSALAAQCEILEKLDTSPQPWHPTCTAMLTQQSSLCLINLDSSVRITVLYSADTFQDISGVLGTKCLW